MDFEVTTVANRRKHNRLRFAHAPRIESRVLRSRKQTRHIQYSRVWARARKFFFTHHLPVVKNGIVIYSTYNTCACFAQSNAAIKSIRRQTLPFRIVWPCVFINSDHECCEHVHRRRWLLFEGWEQQCNMKLGENVIFILPTPVFFSASVLRTKRLMPCHYSLFWLHCF